MSRRRCPSVLAALVLHAGCDLGLGSEPGASPCLVGHVRTEHGCLVPETSIVVDGITAEWPSLDEIPLASTCAAPCEGLAPASLQVAVECTTSDACTLELRVRTRGSVALDGDTRHVLELVSTPERPTTEANRLVLDATDTSFWKNGHRVDEVERPYRVAATMDGYEVAIPIGYVALRGAALVRPYVERRAGTEWTTLADTPAVRACWLTYPTEQRSTRPQTAEPCDEFASRGTP